jgi:hypothetical protein
MEQAPDRDLDGAAVFVSHNGQKLDHRADHWSAALERSWKLIRLGRTRSVAPQSISRGAVFFRAWNDYGT